MFVLCTIRHYCKVSFTGRTWYTINYVFVDQCQARESKLATLTGLHVVKIVPFEKAFQQVCFPCENRISQQKTGKIVSILEGIFLLSEPHRDPIKRMLFKVSGLLPNMSP